MKPGDIVAERFEIERLADGGGMGLVYCAIDQRSGGRVALKVLRGGAPEHVARFEREAEVLARLQHPGVVGYVAHGVGRSGEPYLAMRWLDGEDLSHRIARGRLTVGETIDLGRRVADALGAAHALGVVHRDVKPSNLFLPRREVAEVVVLDFGIARPAGALRGITETGAIIGTPSYMAPEQARGDSEIGPRADVFALGCVLFECLAGHPPFEGASAMAVLLKIVLEDAPRVRHVRADVPESLDGMLLRMMSKDPGLRPADGTEAAALLAGCARDAVPSDGDAAPPTGASPYAVTIALGDTSTGDRQGRQTILTTGERRLVSIVVVAATDPDDETLVAASTAALASPPGAAIASLREIADRHHARLERLLDGTVVMSLSRQGAATDQAAQIARAALSIRGLLPGAPIVAVTGRAVLEGPLPVGEAIERAAALLREERRARREGTAGRPIRIDPLTAALLDERFDVVADGGGGLLRGASEEAEGGRTLLGRPTPFVGRQRELAALVDAYDECSSERMAMAMVAVGPAGAGKSRLRYELLRALRAREAPPAVWIARGDPIRKGSPFGLLAEMVRTAAGLHDGEPIENRRAKLRAHLGTRIGHDDLAFLAEIVGSPFAEASIAVAAARQDARLMGDHVHRAFDAWIAVECAAAPLVVVLEDLHWGDLPTVRLLDQALRDFEDRPLLVVAFARPEIHELFPELWSDRRKQEIRVAELGRGASEELVRHVLGRAAPADVVARLVERSGGNALFLEELIRAHLGGRHDTLPETVVAMVDARLQRLEPDARRVLRAASVFGGVFWRAGVEAMIGTSGGPADALLAALCEREVIVRQREGRLRGQEEYRFRHALVREGAYTMLTEDDLRLGHRLAGAWLEGAGERDPVVLAEHFDRGDERARAIPWYRAAAEQALAGDDAKSVLAWAERAIACGAAGEQLGALRQLQAGACMEVTGDLATTEGYLTEAMATLPRGSALWHRAATAMIALGAFGRFGGMLHALRSLLEEERPGEISVAHLFAWSNAIFFLAVAGQSAAARSLMDRIDRHGPSVTVDNPAAAAWIHRARHYWTLYCEHAPERCLLEAAASARMLEQAGDRRELDWSEIHVGYSLVTLGAYEEGERALRGVVARTSRAEFPRAVAQNFLSGALSGLGRLDEAMEVQGEANEVFEGRGNQLFYGVGRRRVALVCAERGDHEGARREAAAASDLLILSPPHRCYALAIKAQAEMTLGLPSDALASAREAHEILGAAGSVDRGATVVRLAWAEALALAGHRDEARVAIAAARDRLLGLSAGIADPQRRASYLGVPEHLRTLRLADEWQGVTA